MSKHVDCSQLNEIRVDVHRGPLETFAAIDDFTGALNQRLKDLDTPHAMVAVTTTNSETGVVLHQTLELTPHDNGNPNDRVVEVTTINAVAVNGQGMALYRTFAGHSGLWLNGDEQAEDKALQDGEFIEFGLGNINNGICLNKVSNG